MTDFSKWNYRVFRCAIGDESWHEIRECHYDAGTSPDSVPHSWTEEPSAPHGVSPEELAEDFRMMRRALDFPVLEEHGDRLLEVAGD